MSKLEQELNELRSDYLELLDQQADNNSFSKTLLNLVESKIAELKNLVKEESN